MDDWGSVKSYDYYSSDLWATSSTERAKYSKDDFVAALRGARMPPDVATLPRDLQLCVLRGVRHHPAFAAEIRKQLTSLPLEFTRVANARAIMSNEIPDMEAPDHQPYCIWYPDVAAETTYRALAERYPLMRYQVGRACAVAGYYHLYCELDLRPDLSIAEEARDNAHQPGSQAIFDHIVAQPTRWRVMDDYTRTIAQEETISPARVGLNGDTAVRSSLDRKHRFMEPGCRSPFREQEHRIYKLWSSRDLPLYFNITEDWNIDEFTSAPLRPNAEMLSLLWQPLPHDLPPGNKDVLILFAAYHGDTERYARLRRPYPCSFAEELCIVRGIYHSTPFARWWFQKPLRLSSGLPPWEEATLPPCDPAFDKELARFHCTSRARLLMADDLSCIVGPDGEVGDMPYQMWYPAQASAATYLAVARRFWCLHDRRYVVYGAARAMIVCGYYEAWATLLDELDDFLPSRELFVEAEAAPDLRFLGDLHRLREERCPGIGPFDLRELESYCEDILLIEATRRWVDWATMRERDRTEGLAMKTEAEWAGDGGFYDEGGILDLNDIEEYLSQDLGVPGTWPSKLYKKSPLPIHSHPADVIAVPPATSTSLTADQPFQLSATITFQALTIASGTARQLPTDPTRTRICRMSCERLGVDVGGEGGLVSVHSFFIIPSGRPCVVTNDRRVDVVLYVTAVADEME